MKEAQAVTKDPICGMWVDEASALRAERDEKTFSFCSERCQKKFLSTLVQIITERSRSGEGL